MEVARAELRDIDALLPLVRGYREFYKQTHDAKRERALIEAHVRDETATIFLARAQGRAIGFTLLMRYHSTVRLGPALILEDLFVEPSARGSGAADLLLQKAIAYAREIGATGMFLETAYENHRAQAVYERNGWVREGQFHKYNASL